MLRAATPGTLLVLAGTVLLAIATVSAPIWNSVYFLSADFSGSGGGTSVSGRVLFGTFGYCSDDGSTCTDPTLGYKFDANAIAGVSSDVIDLPEGVIKWITYVLVLHPIAAGIGLISLILGIIAHWKEMGVVCGLAASWVAGIASTISLIAFIFDIALFTIAKSRINDASSNNSNVTVDTAAEYGNALWITLAGFLCFAISGCCFRFGRRVVREREADRAAQNAFKPVVNDSYANDAREAARRDEMNRIGYGQSREERGLPSFSEHAAASSDLEGGQGEAVPLARWDENGYNAAAAARSNHGYAPNASVAGGYDREQLPGVGTGYGRREPSGAAGMDDPYNEQDFHAYGGMYDGADPYAQHAPPQESPPMQYQPNYAQNLGPSVQQRLRAGRNQGPSASSDNTASMMPDSVAQGSPATPFTEGIAYASPAAQREDPYAHGLTASQPPSRVRRAPSSVPSQYSDTYGNGNVSANDINTYPPQSPPQQGMSYYDYHQPEPSAYHPQHHQQQHADTQDEDAASYYQPEVSTSMAGGSAPYASGSRGPPSYHTNMAGPSDQQQQTYGGYYRGPLGHGDEKVQQYW